jgi:enamine deaminase RidA (YjgF/YER057c/UK114 family)
LKLLLGSYPVVNVQAVLKVAGSSLGRVVKVTVLPARSMVHFGAEIPGVLVAVEAVALIWGRLRVINCRAEH